MQNAECRSRAQSCLLVPDAGCRCRMQNAEAGPNKAVYWYPMQDADAECRMQNQPQSCELHPMQDADAECRMQKRAQSYSCERRAGCMQDAECGMQKLTHSQERADRVPMQDAGAECKNSPNIGRRGQKKSRTECTMQVQNTESHPRVHCVCAERVCMVQMLSIQTACCMLHVSKNTLSLPQAGKQD